MSDSKAQRLANKWQTAVDAVAQAESNLKLAKTALSKSSAELGDWLVPKDALMRESFNIWVNGVFLEVKVLIGDNRYQIRHRAKQEEA